MACRRLLSAAMVSYALLAGSASAAPMLQDTVVSSGSLAAATTMALAQDGRIFVAEQGGKLRVIKNGTLLPDPFVSLPVTSDNERGLLGVALDPNFATNHFVYVYYTRSSPVTNRVSRFTADGDVAQPGSETVIFDDIPSQAGYHNGGALGFGPDGRLYVAVGENHSSGNAQSTSSLAGKIHRIDADGSIPTDNPFYGSTTGAFRAIWALGLRNPFTFDIQKSTGRIFINDVGQSTWEEIDEAWAGPNTGSNAGLNFGWPDTEGATSDTRYKTPFYAYNHSSGGCAITGGAFYDPATANFPASYVDDYFFADFCQGWIQSIDLSTKAVSTLVPASSARMPVDIDVADDGSLYYLARGEGTVHRVRFVGDSPAGQPPAAAISAPAPLLRIGLHAPKRWHRAWRRGIPVRVSAPAGTHVRITLRRGQRRLAARRVTVGASGTRVVRLRARHRLAPGVLRIEASAPGEDGRRVRKTRRIVLKR